MSEKILILDFGSQYTQLIARAVREANVYCEIIPYYKPFTFDESIKGIILSGSPFSVNDEKAPVVDVRSFNEKLPVLGVCYGAQLAAKQFGGRVEKSNKREYGRAQLQILQPHAGRNLQSFAGLDEPRRFDLIPSRRLRSIGNHRVNTCCCIQKKRLRRKAFTCSSISSGGISFHRR